jgi:surfeit locus 1 family protein
MLFNDGTEGCRAGTRRGFTRGTVFFAIFALLISAGCVRLGFWQVSRLHERQERNAVVLATRDRPAIPVDAVTPETPRFQRVRVEGQYDFEHELVYTSRARNGAPGVNLITPLRLNDTVAVLVNRGWVYAPDGMRIQRDLWPEDVRARVEGYAEPFADPAAGPVATPSVARGMRRLDRDSIAALVPYHLLPVLVVQRLDSGEATATARGIPVRVEPPPLGEGSHRAYAVQWFSFAAVGLFGTVFVLLRDRHTRPPDGRSS